MVTGMSSDAKSGSPRARVFISYSRADLAFADRLAAALKERGFEPSLDRADIYHLEDWWQRIQGLIAQADTVVFVLSPQPVASPICLNEVSFAESLHKRLAPIVWCRVSASTVPDTLRRLSTFFFDDEARFQQSVEELTQALTTDIEWIRKHTEFEQAARRWSAAGGPGPKGLLLRSPILEEAERWIGARPEGAPISTKTIRMQGRPAVMDRINSVECKFRPPDIAEFQRCGPIRVRFFRSHGASP
jgi:TIR domain